VRKKFYKTKRKSQTPRANLKKRLWTIFSLFIRQRDEGICFSCGKKDEWKKMDAGHYIPKTAGLSVYFDEQNVNCQCTYCNRFMHGNLSAYALALRKKYGKNILEELDSKKKKKIIMENKEYESLIEIYKNKVNKLRGLQEKAKELGI
jgi:5-methylcytosine-specific restriction endonuclease McrA